MPGEAKTLQFQLGSATVMVGSLADLWSLRPDVHSLGLIQNFQVHIDPKHVDLSYSSGGSPIFSVTGDLGMTASMNVFEHTARNLQIAMGRLPVDVEVTSAAYILSTPADGTVYASFMSDTDVTPSFQAGSWIMIQSGDTDYVHIAQLSGSYAVGAGPFEITVAFPDHLIPPGNNFPPGSRLMLANVIGLGPLNQPDYMAMKVVSQSSGVSNSIGVLFPKVRITRGFEVSFDATRFSSLPYEFRPYPLLATDIGAEYLAPECVAQFFTKNSFQTDAQFSKPPPPPIVEYRLVTRAGRRILVRGNNFLRVRK